MKFDNIDNLLIKLPKNINEIIFSYYTDYCDVCKVEQEYCNGCGLYNCMCVGATFCNNCFKICCMYDCNEFYTICTCCCKYLCRYCWEHDGSYTDDETKERIDKIRKYRLKYFKPYSD